MDENTKPEAKDARDAEIESLRAQFAAQTAGRKQDATDAAAAYASAQVDAGRIMPIQKEKLAAALVLAAHDDIDTPRAAGSRLGVFKAFIESAEPHQMGKRVASTEAKDKGVTPQANGSQGTDPDAEKAEAAKSFKAAIQAMAANGTAKA